MRIYQRHKSYYIDFRTPQGQRRRWKIGENKRDAQNFRMQLESLVSCKKFGLRCSGEVENWLRELDVKILNRFNEIRLLPRGFVIADDVMAQVDDWLKDLGNKGRTEKHIEIQGRRVKKILEAIGAEWDDITAADIQTVLGEWRRDGMGPTTLNHYLGALKAFGNWMRKNNRVRNSPVTQVSPYNTRTDVRRKRRALTQDESIRLIETTRELPEICGMSGPERALLYHLALTTGLRWSEIRSLKVGSFDLEAEPPAVIVEAGYSKNRREDTIYLRRDIASELLQHFIGKTPETPAFEMENNRGAKILRADLDAAGIPYKTDRGYSDFHSLRHSFISSLARSGVHPSVAQALARHSTITLTMNCYTHTDINTRATAIESLPSLGG